MKIGKKLIIMIIAVALSGIGALSTTILTGSQRQISLLINNELRNLAYNEAGKLSLRLESYFSIARSLANSMQGYEQIEPERRRFFYNILLKQLAEANPEAVAIWTCWEPNALDGLDAQYANTRGTDNTGRFIPSWSWAAEGVRLDSVANYGAGGAGDFYRIPMRTGKETIVEPRFQIIDGVNTLITSLCVPIKKNGQCIGVAGVDIALSGIQADIKRINPYKGSIAMVFSNGGLVTGHFDDSRLGKFMDTTETDLAGGYLAEYINAVKTGSEYSFFNDVNIQGLENQYMFISVPFLAGNSSTPWSLVVGVPQQIIRASVLNMLNISIIIICIMILVIAAAAFLIARSISNPLKNMMKSFISVGEGDLTQRISMRRKDEIGDMAGVFSGTIEKIKNLVITIKNQSGNLADIGNRLSSNMAETAAAINEITATIQSIKGRAINQSASVTESNATMEQITHNIDKVSSNVDRQSDSVTQSSSAIEEMLSNIQSVTQSLSKNASNVRELKEASEVGRAGLQAVAEDIQEIARESEGLLEINAVMENIASQTNLLSMNAAIEAAHAGEAGKGFAVVADEIRKLAENSGEQSKTISAVLKKIKDSIDKITKSTDSVLNKFAAIDNGVRTVTDLAENIRNAMEEQGEGSKQVLEAIGQLNEITRLVKSGSEEMLEGSKQVIQESKNLEMATHEITTGMNEMAASADQINVAVDRVNVISGENKENIDILVQEVSKFKVE